MAGSRSFLFDPLPIGLPLPVDPVQPECQHRLDMIGRPPGAGELEPLLDKVAVGALDFPGTNRKASLEGALIVQLIEAVAEIAIASGDRIVVPIRPDE